MDLLSQVRNGDQRAWNELVAKYQRGVMATALAVVRDLDEADDITQDVFVRLFKKMHAIRDSRSLKSWLMKTAYNLACDRRRYRIIRGWFQGREDPEEVAGEDNPERVAQVELLETVRGWMEAELSKKESLVWQLKVGEEMTLEEIAKDLGMSLSSVKTHYYRAKDKLKKLNSWKGEMFHEL